MNAARVLIADDHPPTRASIRGALEDAGLEVCAEASDGPSAVMLTHRHGPDVALLDIDMPGGGITAARDIATGSPSTKIVMLTVSRDDRDVLDALRAGAAGYLLKGMDPARLPPALDGVLSGEAAIPRTLAARLIEEFRDREGRRIRLRGDRRQVRLTPQEWDVLVLLRDGLTTTEIAERMFIAPVTVRTHVSAILRKLRVPDRESAVRLIEDR